ncbi:MAG TPA: hypothetical protein VGD00_01290 [Solirubrobacteraceae bacterium]|jgi:hypothetical protein
MSFTTARRRALRITAALGATAVAALGAAGAAQAQGNFVIGDQNAVPGMHVTFWGAQWWKLNSLSGGSAPPSFKGFANEVAAAAPSCGESWTTDPGNSSDPPLAPLPPLIEVLVSSSIDKSGRTISGNVTAVALVATDPGYAPNPGHAGTGTVIAVGCTGHENGGGGPT